jgi:hypothetical protein
MSRRKRDPNALVPALPPIRGRAEWAAVVQALTHALGLPSRGALVVRAIEELAASHGHPLPERANPLGTNRFGKPKGGD